MKFRINVNNHYYEFGFGISILILHKFYKQISLFIMFMFWDIWIGFEEEE